MRARTRSQGIEPDLELRRLTDVGNGPLVHPRHVRVDLRRRGDQLDVLARTAGTLVTPTGTSST